MRLTYPNGRHTELSSYRPLSLGKEGVTVKDVSFQDPSILFTSFTGRAFASVPLE